MTTYQLRRLALKHNLLETAVNLLTAFAPEAHPAQGQRLEKQSNLVKLCRFTVGTRMLTI
jgi:hypothetical protein